MLNRLLLTAALSVLITAPQMAAASPITYAFSGDLDQQVDGSTTFSGSFTINANPAVMAWSSTVQEDGSDVSLTLNLGGHIVNFVNTPQMPSFVTLLAFEEATIIGPSPGSPQIAFSVVGAITEDLHNLG